MSADIDTSISGNTVPRWKTRAAFEQAFKGIKSYGKMLKLPLRYDKLHITRVARDPTAITSSVVRVIIWFWGSPLIHS